jgi:hypothetical protein
MVLRRSGDRSSWADQNPVPESQDYRCPNDLTAMTVLMIAGSKPKSRDIQTWKTKLLLHQHLFYTAHFNQLTYSPHPPFQAHTWIGKYPISIL